MIWTVAAICVGGGIIAAIFQVFGDVMGSFMGVTFALLAIILFPSLAIGKIRKNKRYNRFRETATVTKGVVTKTEFINARWTRDVNIPAQWVLSYKFIDQNNNERLVEANVMDVTVQFTVGQQIDVAFDEHNSTILGIQPQRGRLS